MSDTRAVSSILQHKYTNRSKIRNARACPYSRNIKFRYSSDDLRRTALLNCASRNKIDSILNAQSVSSPRNCVESDNPVQFYHNNNMSDLDLERSTPCLAGTTTLLSKINSFLEEESPSSLLPTKVSQDGSVFNLGQTNANLKFDKMLDNDLFLVQDMSNKTDIVEINHQMEIIKEVLVYYDKPTTIKAKNSDHDMNIQVWTDNQSFGDQNLYIR